MLDKLSPSYAAQGFGITSLAEGVAVLLMKCPLLVRAGIRNLVMVPAIARLLFMKDTGGFLTSTNKCQHMGCSSI